MKQIAEELGISRTTVSLILQGKADEYRISPATQRQVLDYVEQKEFRPNYFAQALSGGKTGVIGVVFPDVFESFMSKMIRGIESALYSEGYTLMVSTTRFDQAREKKILEKMIWQKVDGIILAPTVGFAKSNVPDSHYLVTLKQSSIPVVVVDRMTKGVSFPGVFQKDYELAFSYLDDFLGLVENQKKPGRVICVSLNLDASSIHNRMKGASDATQSRGWNWSTILLETQDFGAKDLENAIDVVYSLPSIEPVVFFVTTEGLAEKLYWHLENRGIKEKNILRFGSTSSYLPSLFTREIPQPHEAIGYGAGRYLEKLILRKSNLEDEGKKITPEVYQTTKLLFPAEVESIDIQ